MRNLTISVYGYGRFGKLWADILAQDFKVKVYSRRGLTRDEVSDNIEIVEKKDIFNCDAVFFCVAISSLEELLNESQDYFTKDTVYFDTCSVKVHPVNWMKQYLPSESEIIATHPMFGPDSYYNSAEELPLVMCNVRSKQKTYAFWKDYFMSKPMRIEEMTPDEHDEMVAFSQGITHYVGRVLADLNLKSTKINTLGYEKLLEIIQQTCNDSIQLFIDLQKYNPYTIKMREELHKSIEKIYSLLIFNNNHKNSKKL